MVVPAVAPVPVAASVRTSLIAWSGSRSRTDELTKAGVIRSTLAFATCWQNRLANLIRRWYETAPLREPTPLGAEINDGCPLRPPRRGGRPLRHRSSHG